MVYAKCIKIDTKRHMYLLKDGDGKELWVSKTQLQSVIGKEISIINLDNKTLKYDIQNSWLGYGLLSAEKPSEKSFKVYNKSMIVDACPNTVTVTDSHKWYGITESEHCTGGKYNTLYLTDCTRFIDGDIIADRITFIGEQKLVAKHANTRIVCNRALIYNKSIIDSLSSKLNYDRVELRALEIELRHDYIDENTLYEVYHILYAAMKKYKERGIGERLHYIKVFFKDADYTKMLRSMKRISRYMHDSKREMFLKIQNIVGEVPLDNMTGEHTKLKDDTVYNYLNKWCTYMMFLVSMQLSVEDAFGTWIKEECDKTLEVMFKIVRSYGFEFNNVTDGLRKIRKLNDDTLNLMNRSAEYE